MSIMIDYAHRYDDSINNILNFNILRNEYDLKIKMLNKLRKEKLSVRNEYYVYGIARDRKIKQLEEELFHSKGKKYG